MGEKPVGEGGAVPVAGGVEVGGEQGEDLGAPQYLGGRVGVGEAVGGKQGERAEGANLDLDGARFGFDEQRGQGIAGGGIVQAGQRAESGKSLQRQGRQGQQAVIPRRLAGTACLTRNVGQNLLNGVAGCRRGVQDSTL